MENERRVQQKAPASRYALLDELRGLDLISMMLYHAGWDLVFLFDMNMRWYAGTPGRLWQQSICWVFILLSGFCVPLGRHTLRRGVTVFAAGALVTAVTLVFMPGDRVIFGVLTFLGAAALLTVPLRSLLDRTPPRLGLAVSFLLFLLVRDVNSGFLGFAGVPVLHLPQSWYASTLTTALGFPYPGFVSSNYFSLLPWLLLFWTGYHLYRLRPETPALPDIRLPGLMAMGRHSLVIYLLHQPVIYGLLALIFS